MALLEKLNNKNYSHWSYKMKILLKKENCWRAIEENEPEDYDDAWETIDSKAMQYIVLCIEDRQLVHVKRAGSAKEMWDKLKAYHCKSTLSCRIRILKKLFKAELDKNGNMEDHLQRIFEWLDELEEMDGGLDESLSVSVILASLSEEYDTLITAMEAWDETKLTLETVRSKLLDEWEKRMASLRSRLNSYNKEHNRFLREYLKGMVEVSLDASNRILVPKRLLDLAKIESTKFESDVT